MLPSLLCGLHLSFVTYFHSDGSNNAWGYKFKAVPVFPPGAAEEKVEDGCKGPLVFGASPFWCVPCASFARVLLRVAATYHGVGGG